jgi:DUF4097 and DUF4098 domain-containing protein YvlB
MRSKICLTVLALVPAAALAWGDDCEFRADRSAGVDAQGVEKVVIRAGAGDMKTVGVAKARRIEARGPACASKQALLDATQINVRREGNVVYVETSLPDDDSVGWARNQYAWIDIGIAVPNDVAVEAHDSSGDSDLEDLASLVMQDSSGDLQIHRVAGVVDVTDSSGEIVIEDVGSVRMQDSSGDISIGRVRQDVDIVSDSSGGIEVENVDGSVLIQNDSSGEIHVEDVKGSVTIDADSSGSIYAGRVGGDFTVRADSSGSIEHESVRGKVTVPSNKSED